MLGWLEEHYYISAAISGGLLVSIAAGLEYAKEGGLKYSDLSAESAKLLVGGIILGGIFLGSVSGIAAVSGAAKDSYNYLYPANENKPGQDLGQEMDAICREQDEVQAQADPFQALVKEIGKLKQKIDEQGEAIGHVGDTALIKDELCQLEIKNEEMARQLSKENQVAKEETKRLAGELKSANEANGILESEKKTLERDKSKLQSELDTKAKVSTLGQTPGRRDAQSPRRNSAVDHSSVSGWGNNTAMFRGKPSVTPPPTASRKGSQRQGDSGSNGGKLTPKNSRLTNKI